MVAVPDTSGAYFRRVMAAQFLDSGSTSVDNGGLLGMRHRQFYLDQPLGALLPVSSAAQEAILHDSDLLKYVAVEPDGGSVRTFGQMVTHALMGWHDVQLASSETATSFKTQLLVGIPLSYALGRLGLHFRIDRNAADPSGDTSEFSVCTAAACQLSQPCPRGAQLHGRSPCPLTLASRCSLPLDSEAAPPGLPVLDPERPASQGGGESERVGAAGARFSHRYSSARMRYFIREPKNDRRRGTCITAMSKEGAKRQMRRSWEEPGGLRNCDRDAPANLLACPTQPRRL